MSNPSIPGVPFDPRVVGPLDLLRSGVGRLHAWAVEHSRELIAVVGLVLIVQIVVYAQYDVVFLRPPKIPAWALVMVGALVFMAPWAVLVGILLGRGLHEADTVLIHELSAQSGEGRLRHVSPERWENVAVYNQNGERREIDYLQRVSINGRDAWEVDCYDVENNRVIASSMAGRTNREVRQDRREIKRIKTDQEREVDEAIEFKINFRDIVRERAAAVANWIIRTSQDATVPNGGDLYDQMEDSLADVDPYGDLHSPGDAGRDRGDDEDDDGDRDDSAEAAVGEAVDAGLADIFERARQNGDGGVTSDD